MKSEERHQLLTNDLSVATKAVAGGIEQHAGTLIAVVAGVAIACGIGLWWSSSSDADVAAAWTQLDTAQTLEDFGDIADKYKGKPAGEWAQLISSERILQSAMPLMFTNRELAQEDIKKAREGFDALVTQKNVLSSIRERALWGLALCLETTCDGQTEKPIKAYERLTSEYPDSMFKTVAEERIAALKNKGAADFYAWFSKEKPEPPEARPKDFKDGINLPAPKAPAGGNEAEEEMEGLIPKNPNAVDMPKQKPEEGAPVVESKKEEPAEKPKAEQPAEGDKPKTETPNGEEKPGEKK